MTYNVSDRMLSPTVPNHAILFCQQGPSANCMIFTTWDDIINLHRILAAAFSCFVCSDYWPCSCFIDCQNHSITLHVINLVPSIQWTRTARHHRVSKTEECIKQKNTSIWSKRSKW